MAQDFPWPNGRFHDQFSGLIQSSLLPKTPAFDDNKRINVNIEQGDIAGDSVCFSDQTISKFRVSLDNSPPLEHVYETRLPAAGTHQTVFIKESEHKGHEELAKAEKKKIMNKLRKRILEKRPDLEKYLILLQRSSAMERQGLRRPKRTKEVRIRLRRVRAKKSQTVTGNSVDFAACKQLSEVK